MGGRHDEQRGVGIMAGGVGVEVRNQKFVGLVCDNAKSQTVTKSDNRTPEAVGESKNAKLDRIYSSA